MSEGPQPEVLVTVLYATGGVFEVPILRRVAEKRSPFQEIVVVDTELYGRCLVLDGVMQTASTDHLLYDDAILARLRPTDRAVLIIGGGDGYVARRALDQVPELRLGVVDIDPDVVALAEAHLNPGLGADPRIELHVGDGLAFARAQSPGSLDGVVLDLTDVPLAPDRSGEGLQLFADMIAAALPLVRPGGWLSLQAGPSEVPPGEQKAAALIGEMLAGRLDDIVREDVFLPSYAEKNAFFHGVVRRAPPGDEPAINWHDRTMGMGLSTALTLTRVHFERTPGGVVEVFDHARLGRALVVEGALQSIDEDAAWRELLAHVPLLGGARAPRSVLLVGGGDGLVLAEVLRHPFVERVTVWDDNEALRDVGRRHLGTAAALADLRVRFAGAAADVAGLFDVVLIAHPDLRRPGDASTVGARLAGWLAPDGVIADADAVVIHRAGARWYRDTPEGAPSLRVACGLQEQGRYFATGAVVPGGFYGFALLGAAAHDWSTPRSAFAGRHYNAELHAAAFALPRFIRELP